MPVIIIVPIVPFAIVLVVMFGVPVVPTVPIVVGAIVLVVVLVKCVVPIVPIVPVAIVLAIPIHATMETKKTNTSESKGAIKTVARKSLTHCAWMSDFLIMVQNGNLKNTTYVYDSSRTMAKLR